MIRRPLSIERVGVGRDALVWNFTYFSRCGRDRVGVVRRRPSSTITRRCTRPWLLATAMRRAAVAYCVLGSRSGDADESGADWYPAFMVQAVREAEP